MNNFQNEQHTKYQERRREVRDKLSIDRPQWYIDAKNKFDNERNYETKKQYERELQDKINKYLDETVY